MIGRSGATRTELWSTVLVVVLAVVGVVALWPRATSDTVAEGPAPATDLASLRTAAALAPCPAPTGAPAAGPLRDVTVECLGAPGRVDLGAALAGRPALLNVWASWCAPCRAELPALAAYARRPGAVPVLGIDLNDDPRAALALLRDLGVTLPSVTDPHDALRAALALPPTLPLSYVVRVDGTVARVDPPTPFGSADEVAAAVERLR